MKSVTKLFAVLSFFSISLTYPNISNATFFSNELKFRGYDCVNGKASKADGYVEMSFIVKDKKIIRKQKSVDTQLKQESMHSISELSDCVIYDNKNWRCGGGTYRVGAKTYESYLTQLIDGRLFFGKESETNVSPGCFQYFIWEKIN